MAESCSAIATMLSMCLCAALLLSTCAESTIPRVNHERFRRGVETSTVSANETALKNVTIASVNVTTPLPVNTTIAASTVAPVIISTMAPNVTVHDNTTVTIANVTSNATVTPAPIVNTTMVVNVTSTTVPPIVNKTEVVTPVPPPIASNISTAINKKNLGENGTGIRKNDCESIKKMNSTAICVSDPISSNDTTAYDIDKFGYDPVKVFSDHNETLQLGSHTYYNSTFLTHEKKFTDYWNMLTKSGQKISVIFSNTYGKALAVSLSFLFPFYGRPTNNIKIATGGFIFVGDNAYDWIIQTQFIAPLMANFDLRLRNDSTVKHIDNGTALTVIWDNIAIKENASNAFTFALTLHRNGDIVFAYKNVPMAVSMLNYTHHPVEVGISDAYIIEQINAFVTRKHIVKYHKIDFKLLPITNNTLIYFTALPTCGTYNTCDSCLNHNTSFDCTWCPSANRCSDGIDRLHQDWSVKDCVRTNYTRREQCLVLKQVMEPEGSSATTIANVLISLIVIASILGWFVYAYRNPHTYSGQLLIKAGRGAKYRPSQWSWRRGEARYTAATIHM